MHNTLHKCSCDSADGLALHWKVHWSAKQSADIVENKSNYTYVFQMWLIMKVKLHLIGLPRGITLKLLSTSNHIPTHLHNKVKLCYNNNPSEPILIIPKFLLNYHLADHNCYEILCILWIVQRIFAWHFEVNWDTLTNACRRRDKVDPQSSKRPNDSCCW